MKQSENITLTHSSIIAKNGQPYVAVRFERGNDYAEGSVPECKIINSSGFSQEETLRLEEYLRENSRDTLVKAKNISGLFHLLR